MQQKVLQLPTTSIVVKKNGERICFTATSEAYDQYLIETKDGNKLVYADGARDLSIDLRDYSVGDIITCELEVGTLQCHKGEEHMQSIVGAIDDFVIGISAIDTEYINKYLTHNDNSPLPYSIYISESGIKIEITGEVPHVSSPDDDLSNTAHILVVWCDAKHDYAWEMIRFLSS